VSRSSPSLGCVCLSVSAASSRPHLASSESCEYEYRSRPCRTLSGYAVHVLNAVSLSCDQINSYTSPAQTRASLHTHSRLVCVIFCCKRTIVMLYHMCEYRVAPRIPKGAASTRSAFPKVTFLLSRAGSIAFMAICSYK